MENSKNKKGIYAAAISSILALTMLLSGCGKDKEDVSDNSNVTSIVTTTGEEDNYVPSWPYNVVDDMKFEDVVENVSEFTYLDNYLKDNKYEYLISDYIGFKENGDLESARNQLSLLGEIVLKGSVIDTLYREDPELVSRLGEEFNIGFDSVPETRRYGIYVSSRGDEQNSPIHICYDTNGLGADLIGSLMALRYDDIESFDEERLDKFFDFFKAIVVSSGTYVDDSSVLSSNNSNESGCDNGIDFNYDSVKVATLK